MIEGVREGSLLGFFVQPDSQGEIQCLLPSHVSSSPVHSNSSLDSSIYLSSSHSEDSLPSDGVFHTFSGNALHIERERIPVPGKCYVLPLNLVCIRDNWAIQWTLRLWDCSDKVCLLSSPLWEVIASKEGICLHCDEASLLLPQPVEEGQWATVVVSARNRRLSLSRDNQPAVSMEWSPTEIESVTMNTTKTVMDVLAFEICQDEEIALQLLVPYYTSISAH